MRISTLGTVVPLWQSSFLLLTWFKMCLPPAETYRAGVSQAALPAVCRSGIDCFWLSSAQGGESPAKGRDGEDKQDTVSLPAKPLRVLFPSFQDPVLVNLHLKSNAFCILLVGLLQWRSWLAYLVLGKWNAIPQQIALARMGKDADFYFLGFLWTLL